MTKPDVHFLIDNAPPLEVLNTLRCLDSEYALSVEEIRVKLKENWGYQAQKDLNYSTRRLFDLQLTIKVRKKGSIEKHALTERGMCIKEFLLIDQAFTVDLLHFLHYDGYKDINSRKLFWSYRQCCDIAWARKEMPKAKQLATEIQALINNEFPEIYTSVEVGGRFNEGGVSSWKSWLTALSPSPILSDSRIIVPRKSDRVEYIPLALDHVYQKKSYLLGSPVLLDDKMVDMIAQVFYLDGSICRELIDVAARLFKSIELSDTLSGTSITLSGRYQVEDI